MQLHKAAVIIRIYKLSYITDITTPEILYVTNFEKVDFSFVAVLIITTE